MKFNPRSRLLALTFRVSQSLGWHVTRMRAEDPVPDTRKLADELWQKHSQLPGLNMNDEGQLALLGLFASKFKAEYDLFPPTRTPTPYRYYINNGFFASVDGEVLYCMVRYFKPRIVYEIGSGNSTYLFAQAIQKNMDEDPSYSCELNAVEPSPNKVLRAGFPNLTRLISSEVQDVPLSEFERLKANDFLFIDSSHELKIGSDVCYEYLEILTRLHDGVIVHSHDIFLPAQYPRDWVLKNLRFLNEQYLLQAFLSYNDYFEVMWSGSYMHLTYPERLEAVFESYSRHDRWPSSFWFRKTKSRENPVPADGN